MQRAGLVDVQGVADDSVVVTGITHDSRAVQPGDLYAALPGANVHGADFAANAVQAGAAAILTDADGAQSARGLAVPVIVAADPRLVTGPVSSLIYGEPSRQVPVVGITGTNGKTTTTWMIEAVARAAGLTSAVIGTAGVRIGTEVIPSARTTPEAPDLQALLGLLAQRGVDLVAMEVSSHALALHRVDGTHFAVAGFTHLTQDHLDFHHDMESYFQAKLRLFTDGFADHSCVVVDDEWGQRIAAASDSPVTRVSARLAPDLDVQWQLVDEVSQSLSGQHFRARGPLGHEFDVTVHLPGSFNIANALLALSVADALRLPVEFASRGLADVAVPGRMERVSVEGAPLGIVDYAHTPDAVARAVEATVATAHPLVVVLGAGGDRDAEKRPFMGQAAAERADVVVITDDNPRSEDPAVIRGSVASGATRGSARVVEVADRREAIRAAVAAAGTTGVVLVLGKGHESGQEVAGVMHPFDDRHELLTALQAFVRGDLVRAGESVVE